MSDRGISGPASLRAARYHYRDQAELLDDYFRRGWTDGLPVVAPEPDVVRHFLEVAETSADTIVGELATRDVVVTSEHVAINAVMAGCRPEYLPVVLAAVRALLHPYGHAHSTSGSLAGPPHVIVVNGPVARTLQINEGLGCFGPGWRANATIGRALRLVVRNCLHAVPGELDRAAYSHPGRFTFCFAEDDSADSLVPLHVERGYPAASSTVTVFASWVQSAVWADAATPEELAEALAAEICYRGTYGSEFVRDHMSLLIVIPPPHQALLADAGWSKARLRDGIWARTSATRAQVDYSKGWPKGYQPGRVMLQSAENILIVAAGGEGLPQSWVFFPHAGSAVTEPIEGPVPADAGQTDPEGDR